MKKKLRKILVIFFMFFVSAGIIYAETSTTGLDFSNNVSTCKSILGPNLTNVVHAGIRAIQIIGAIIAIVKGMMILIPAVVAKDADGLKKASKTLVDMAIILVIIFMFPGLLRFMGKIIDFDISCIF